jgi:hypothetical protein
MERPLILMGWQNQYCENVYTTIRDLHIQCNPIKIPMTFLTETENSIPKCLWKQKRPSIAKAILSKMSIATYTTMPDFTLESSNNKNIMVLAQKQT